MRYTILILLICLLNISILKANDDDIDEEVAIDDAPATSSSSPTIEKTNVPTIKSSSSNIYFEEQFQDKSKWSRWVKSQAKKDGVDEVLAKYDGEWALEIPQSSAYYDDYALILKSKARHHAISSNLLKPFDFSTSPLVVQYEVKYQTNQECGGAYVKLLSSDGKQLDLKQVTDKTPYTIMFGPDMCGAEHKYHFIVRYRNPKTGVYSEHQAKKPTEPLDSYFTDKKSHLYTLVLSADNSFKVYIDNKLINSGNLLTDMEPSLIPSKEIVDETDRKPDDWDDRERIPDTDAKKPSDWDETEPKEIADQSAAIPDGWLENESSMVSDPDAVKPADWDDEIDGVWEAPKIDNPLCKDAPGCGEWTAPMVPNPAYKGAWRAPLVDNPNYRGKWEPRKIPNPDYFEETHPYKLTPIGSLALELWSMVDGVVFDNFLLTSDQSIAKQYADQLWYPKSILEGKAISSASDSVIDAIVRATKERPWLWAVYLVAILLPIILLFVFCWSKKSTKKLTDGSKKKKDEVEQDSNEQQQLLTSADNDEETEEIEIDEQQVKSNVTNVSGKDALENDDEGQDAEEEQEEEEDEEEEVNAAETNEDESNKSSSPSASNKARRRLLRKE
ncbi:unnamed protein product [Rotaria sordida]|uniref:Calnexin n=1 Tax=Rotaria sordida TaxID=392033 RepID=A0A819KJC5_9BILA|nr:unnamed protein product [Rotaria sordida]CAF0961692.1 unnamed protein product [Rotaria sordida]CAF0999934.1 unnamed protein product [Rotaria sordida]CAF3698473.1 unnamed protein product [Rotaria sordida]CAF3881009.1 unnamed protein product [Rotaria sordida]